jgi:hypothetical protein
MRGDIMGKYCLNCGKKIEGKNKKFCSADCRDEWNERYFSEFSEKYPTKYRYKPGEFGSDEEGISDDEEPEW